MTLLRKPSTLFLMAVFTVMGALLGATFSHLVIPSAFAQTSSSLAQDIVDSAQQEETGESLSSSSVADDNTQSNTNPQSFDLDLDQDVEAEVEQEAEQAADNLVALQDEEEEDTTPPILTVPEEDITEEATGPDGAVVRFEVTAEDNVDGTATLDEENTLTQDDDVGGEIDISCDPPSGSEFPIGEIVVECTATDEAGNIGRASFTVTVNPVEFPRENGKIAFNRFIENSWEIFVMNADGSDPQRLTNNPGLDAKPDWGPDGTKIVFYCEGYICVMNADGSNQQRLTNNQANDFYPDWSPDGSKIAFTTDRHGSIGTNEEIYVMNADGSGQRNLSNDPGQDLDPGWSPDGTKIVFYSLRDRQSEIYVMNADGSGQTRLTDNPAGDENPDWGPAADID
jgi:hypothetical protein